MKRITTIVCLTACLFCYIPNSSSQRLIDTSGVSIFEIRGKPKSAEENFENLFANFHFLIDNSDEIELLSYKLIAIVDTVEKATKYLSQNFSPGAPAWDISYTRDHLGRIKNTKILVQETLELNKNEIDNLIRNISINCIKKGDRIFQLNLVINEVEYEYFIFIDKDNHVIKEGNLFAFEVSRPA
jgi:hypothetical protein